MFPRLKIKLKGRQFDAAEVTEAELRPCLTPSQKTTSSMRLKICRSAGIRSEGNYFEDVVRKPKIMFNQVTAPIPENIDGCLCTLAGKGMELLMTL
jgi:hypothetical protein